jgi:tRNA(adenine34) deaminase
MTEELRRQGLERLQALPASELRERLEAFRWQTLDDCYVWLSCGLALEAVEAGNYGVGAVIVRGGKVVAEGRNRLVKPYLRTDRHAEMEAVDGFEEMLRDIPDATGTTMYTSLECCPMCTVRLINSGIREVLFAAPDPDGGMLGRWEGLPPFWQSMATRRQPPQRFGQAPCAPELSELAAVIFHTGSEQLDVRIAAR